MRIVVDFPAPLLPRNPKISPGSTSNETWSTARNAPKRRVRSRTVTACMVIAPAPDRRRACASLRRGLGPRALQFRHEQRLLRVQTSVFETRPALKRSATTRRASAAAATSSTAAAIEARAASRSSRRWRTSNARVLSKSASRSSTARLVRRDLRDVCLHAPAVPQRPRDVHADVERVVPLVRAREDPRVRLGVVVAGPQRDHRLEPGGHRRPAIVEARRPRLERLPLGPPGHGLREQHRDVGRAGRDLVERGVDHDGRLRRNARDALEIGVCHVAHVVRFDQQHPLARQLRLDAEHVVGRDQADGEHVLHVAQVRLDELHRLFDHAHRLVGGHQRPERAGRVQPDVRPDGLDVLPGGQRVGFRRALEAFDPPEGVDGPLEIDPRAPVVGDVRVDDGRRIGRREADTG